MKPIYDTEHGKIYQGNCLEILELLPNESVHCCVTSPPYWGLRDYGTAKWIGGDSSCDHVEKEIRTGMGLAALGEKYRGGDHKQGDIEKLQFKSTCEKCGAVRVDDQVGLELSPGEYVEKLVAVFCEVKRVLRTNGTLWLNLGDTYGTGTRADRVRGDLWLGEGTEKARQIKRHGGAAKQLIGAPWRVAFALQAAGWYLRQDIIWHKPNPMPESVKDRCTKSHEYLFLLSKSQRYHYDHEAIKEPTQPDSAARYDRGRSDTHKWADGGPGNQTIAKSFSHMKKRGPQKGYQRPNKEKASVGPMARGKEGFNHQFADPDRVWDDGETRNKRSVWTCSTKPFSGAHFAVFPTDLIEPCILAGCPEGGTVLDPFFGSGTTGLVAHKLDRNFIGIELNETYCREIAIPRLNSATAQNKFNFEFKQAPMGAES